MTVKPGWIRILVLCTGNSCRSQMAEGFFRHYGGAAIEVCSAGTKPQGIHPRAIRVMGERGIDLSVHRSQHVDEYVGQTFDYVITVCDNAAANCPAFPGDGKRLHWPFNDPAAAIGSEDTILGDFRRVRDQIEAQVRRWLSENVSIGK